MSETSQTDMNKEEKNNEIEMKSENEREGEKIFLKKNKNLIKSFLIEIPAPSSPCPLHHQHSVNTLRNWTFPGPI